MNQLKPAERRKAKLRQHIIEQATQLYYDHGGQDGGFEKTTIEEIAEKSDISLRTFFRYFESKTDVIYLDIKTAVDDLNRFIRSRPPEEAPTLAAINGRFEQVHYFLDDKANKERLLRSLRAPQFKERLIVLRSEIKQCIFKFLIEKSDRGEPLPVEHARLASSLITDIAGDVLDDWSNDTKIDVVTKSLEIIEVLPEITKLLKKAKQGRKK